MGEHESGKGKWQEPADAAKIWARYIQPAGEATGLELVSWTTGFGTGKTKWHIDFLKACWSMRDDPDFPCDVDAIKVWSVHDYKCSERKIRAQLRNYKWHDKLAKAVAKSVDGDKDWVTYMRKDQFGSQRPTATGTRMSPRPKSSAGGS